MITYNKNDMIKELEQKLVEVEKEIENYAFQEEEYWEGIDSLTSASRSLKIRIENLKKGL